MMSEVRVTDDVRGVSATCDVRGVRVTCDDVRGESNWWCQRCESNL